MNTIGQRVTQSVLQSLADAHGTTVAEIRTAVILRRPVEREFQRMMDEGIRAAMTCAVSDKRAARRARVTA